MESGDYLNTSEVLAAFNEYLNEDKSNQMVVCRRNGKRVTKEDLQNKIVSVLDKAGGIVVRGRNENITNQNSAKYHLYGETPKNRTFFLGNKGVELPSGHYVLKEELQQALADYMLVDKKENKSVVSESKDSKNDSISQVNNEETKERHRVVGRKKGKWNLKALAATALIIGGIILGGGLGINKNTSNAAQYKVAPIEYVQVVEDVDQDVMDSLTTGSPIDVQNGIEYFHESDQVTDIKGDFGSELRPAGTYNLDYVSVLHNNEILDVAEQSGVNVNDFVNQIASQSGIDKDDLTVMVHLGGPVSGWSKLDDLLSKYGKPAQVIHTEIDEIRNIEGTEHNFNGKLSVDVGGRNNVDMTVVDTQGHILPTGSIVKGSDNQQYKIKELDLQEEVDGYGINWSVDNICNRAAVIAGLTSAVGTLGLIAAHKKGKKEVEEKETVQNKEAEFNKARDNYQKQSKFSKVTSYVNQKFTSFNNKMAQMNERIIAAQPTTIMNNNDMGRHM